MKKILCAVLFAAAVLFASPAMALDLGDTAPAIAVDEWVTGEPVDPTVVDGEHFYLVEVWSVTCPPCVQSIPIMNDIQKRYADKGLRIVSFTSDAKDEVTPFLDQHPIEYSSFIDKEGASIISYMAADNRTTIPHAFLFDKSGALVWIGNPLDNLESRIQGVLSGKLNANRALAIKKARADFQAAIGGQNIGAMLESLQTLEELEPENAQYFAAHYSILTEFGAGDENDVKELFRTWYAAAEGSAESMMHLSLFALDQGMPSMRDPALALSAAKKAYAMGGETRLQSGLTLAEAYKTVGRIDLAKAVLDDLLGKTENDEEKDVIQSIVDFFARLEEVGKNPDAPYNP